MATDAVDKQAIQNNSDAIAAIISNQKNELGITDSSNLNGVHKLIGYRDSVFTNYPLTDNKQTNTIIFEDKFRGDIHGITTELTGAINVDLSNANPKDSCLVYWNGSSNPTINITNNPGSITTRYLNTISTSATHLLCVIYTGREVLVFNSGESVGGPPAATTPLSPSITLTAQTIASGQPPLAPSVILTQQTI